MLGEIGEALRRSEPRQIVAMGIEADRRAADAARDQGALRRPRHAHRKIGFAARQVLIAVTERQLDRNRRMVG